jgi:hypothetical protein
MLGGTAYLPQKAEAIGKEKKLYFYKSNNDK